MPGAEQCGALCTLGCKSLTAQWCLTATSHWAGVPKVVAPWERVATGEAQIEGASVAIEQGPTQDLLATTTALWPPVHGTQVKGLGLLKHVLDLAEKSIVGILWCLRAVRLR